MAPGKDDIYVSKGHKAFWKLLFPYSCFALAIYCGYHAWVKFFSAGVEHRGLVLIVSFLLILPLVVIGIYFSRIEDFYFDFGTKRYKAVTRVGIFKVGTWKRFQNLNYVSLFSNLDDNYQLNLWYDGNRHFKIDTFWLYKDAQRIGKEIAEQLDIEFYDADAEMKASLVSSKERLVQKEDRQVDVHITQGRRPIWKTLVASGLFVAAMFLLLNVINGFDIDFQNKKLTLNFFALEFALLFLGFGVALAVVQDYQFDFRNDQFKHIYRLGPIKFGLWEALEQLDYVSVFKK
ncbi:MAG: hypothetical protein AAF466_05565, partial [Bacteroidota bacterium]